MKLIDKMVEYFTRLNKRMKRWQRVVSVLSAIVVFVTTYALILPAITLDVDTASTQAGIEVASENEPDAAGTVYESAEEEADDGSSEEEEITESSDNGSAVTESSTQEDAEEADAADTSAAEASAAAATTSKAADTVASTAESTAESVIADTAAAASTEEAPALITEATQLTYQGKDYIVYADFDGSAQLPVGVELKVKEITKESDPEAYEVYYKKALEELKDKYDENTGLSFAKFYDISFVFKGQEVEPKGNVNIKIEYEEAVKLEEETKVDAVHFDKEDDEKAKIIDSENKVTDDTEMESIEFESDKFSVYGVIGTETFTEKFLTEDGETYNISVTAGAEAHIPADAHLEISEVKEGSDKYDELFAKAQAAVTDGKDASVPFARFFDIAIVKDGEKIQPDAPVDVKISFDETVEANKNAVFNAVHIADDGENVDVLDVETEGEESEETVAVDAVQFSAEGFSIYGVTYTVDFEYTDPITGKTYYYSIDGESSINLSDLLVVLGIKSEDEAAKFVAEEVTNVEFSDPELVKVTQKGKALGLFGKADWLLESLQPFNTEETLTISLKDGGEIKVVVKDLQYTTSLNDVLTDLTISGAEWDAANNQYVVKDGKKYGITMTFQEGEAAGEYQFSNDGWMTLTLPDGITFERTGNTFPIYVNEAGNNFTINGNEIAADGNSIKVKLNSGDPNYQRLKDLTTATFTVNVSGEFKSNEGGYSIDGKTDTDIKVDSSNDVTIQKSGSITNWNADDSYATVKYTLRVVSNGTNKNVVIKDVISGETITYNGDVTVKKEGGDTVNWSKTTDGNGFTITSGEMKDGEVYLVEYTARIDKNKLNSETGAFDLGDNRNTVTWDGGHPTPYDINHTVTTGINKSAGTVTSDGSIRTIPWTITAYSDFGTNNQLHTITDTIKTEGLHYAGDKVHVVVYNNDVNPPTIVTERDLNWSDVGVTDKNSATGFELNVIEKLGDNTGKKYKYVVTYDTQYNASNLTQNINVNNESEDDHGHKGPGGAGIEPNPENKMDLSKTMESAVKGDDGKTIVTWHVNVTVPKAGLTAAQAVLVENLPSAKSGSTTFQDTYVEGSFKVNNGLLMGETAVINAAESTDGKLVINFTKNGTDLGLNASSSQRTIELELKTVCDTDWIAAADSDPNVTRTHTNQAVFNNIYRDASYTPPETRFEKTGRQNGTDADKLPKFTYNLLVGVISDELFASGSEYVKEDSTGKYIELVDTFDQRLRYIAGSAKVYAGDNRFDVNGWETTLSDSSVISDPANNKVTFRLYQDQLPKNNDKLLSYYKVAYELAIKDNATFEQLQNEAVESETHKVVLHNTAEGFGNTNFDIEYEPNVLDKSHYIENGKLYFTITVNEDELTLSDNGVLVLTDTMTNLSVRYQDIIVAVDGNKTVETTDAEGNPVTAPYFNMKGDTITFYIPDGVKTTITYAATPRGEVGPDGNIHYSNTAKLQGFEKTDSGDKKYESEASGYGTNYGVNIYKADALVNSNALAGAVFKLFEVNEEDAEGNIISGSPVKNSDGSDYTVTTSDGRDGNPKGTVLVMGIEDLGWNLKPEKRYYLLEVVAPEGYALDNTKYSFVISKDGYVNYTRYPVVAPDGSGKIVQPWTYHNGDVLTVKDVHKEGVLTLTKGFEGLNTPEPDDDQKAAISFKVYKLNDSTQEYELFRTIAFDQLTKNEEGKYSYSIGDLEVGQYKVVEIVNDVTCRETTYEVVDPEGDADNTSAIKEERYATIKISEEDVANNTENKVNITNVYNVPSEFKIYKYGSPAGIAGETSYKLAKAKFEVYETDASGQITGTAIDTLVTDSRGKFTILMDESKYAYDTLYAVQEKEAPEGFELNDTPHYFYFLAKGEGEKSGLPEGTVQIGYLASKTENVANTPKTTYIEAKKIWLNDMLEEEDKNTSVKVRIKQIASYDKAGTVIEEALSGYYSANSAEPVIQERATTFKIEKVAATEGSEAHWQLAKDTVDDPKLVDGKLTGLPTMTIKNHIPIYYSYQVEEVETEETAGYVASYEYEKLEDGGTSATVTNKPNTNNPTTRVKAQKRWVDVKGEDITDKMGLEDGVSVDVYRYNGPLNRGTIVEADGSLKDPTDMFTLIANYDSGRATIDNAYVSCLPGDVLRFKIRPLTTLNGKPFSELPENAVIIWFNNFKPTITKDMASGCFIAEFSPSKDMSNFRVELGSDLLTAEISVENITSIGRTQILTQADVDAIPESDKKFEETLQLNKQNGWTATSKEYIKNGRVTKTVTEWGWTHDVTEDVVFTYFIVEPNGNNFDAGYTVEGDVTTVTNVDKKLEVDKTWFAANGTDDITNTKENGTVTYTIKRNKYVTPVPKSVTITKEGLSTTYNGNINLQQPSEPIKVGATVKMTLQLAQNQATVEDSPMDGLTITGVTDIKDSGPKQYIPNSEQPHNYHVVREYQFVVTDNINLSGEIEMARTAAQNGLSIRFDILKQPSDAYIPSEDDEAETIGEPIGTVTVGYDQVVSSNFTDVNVTVKSGETPWSVMVNKLPGKDETYTYTYYVEENVLPSDDFVNVSITPSQGTPVGGIVQVVNQLKSGSLKVAKAVEGVNPEKTYEIAVIDSDGNYYGTDGTNYGTTPHYVSFNDSAEGMEHTWNPLTPGTYTVTERNASQEGYTWTVTGTDAVRVNMNETAETTVTNSYYKNAEYTPSITKALKIGGAGGEDYPWPDGAEFDFYLSFVSGENEGTQLTKSDVILNNREATATEDHETAQFNLKTKDPETQQEKILPGIEFKKPGTYVFSIEEVEPAGTSADHKKDGIVYSDQKVTLTVVVGEKEGESGVLEVKSHTYDISDPTFGADAGLITNKPDFPTYAPSVTKKLTDTGQVVTDWGEKSFTFSLAYTGSSTDTGRSTDVIMPSETSKTVTKDSTNHKETFNAIAFKEAGTYTFTVTEQSGADANVNYDTTPKTIVVTVERDANNNLNVTKVNIGDNEITGEAIVGSGVEIENTIITTKDFEFTKIWKTIGDQIEEWPTEPTEKTIGITLYSGVDTEVAVFTLTKNGGTTGDYTWTAKKNDDNTYTFKITGLPAVDGNGQALEYYVKETKVDGYKDPEYGMAVTTTTTGENNETVTTTTVVSKTTDKDRAKDKEYITNRPNDAVTLPNSGGPGTKLLYGLGISLVGFAGLLLFIKRRELRDLSKRRW